MEEVTGDGLPERRRRYRTLTGVIAAAVATTVVLVVTNPFGGGSRGAGRHSFGTSLTGIAERSLSAQTQLNGTLGFVGDWTVRVPAGTGVSVVAQAQASLSTDQRMLASARSARAGDQQVLDNARGALTADMRRQAVDCVGDNSAVSSAASAQGATDSGVCASDAQLASSDRQAVAQAAAKVATDVGQESSAERSLAGAQSEVDAAQAQETVYGQHSVYTRLPAAGQVVRRGQDLYAIDGRPVLLLYGSAVDRRAFRPGMSSGPDVAQLNANLDALGYNAAPKGDSFTSGTVSAIEALQRAHALQPTGTLLVGSVVFEPGAVRVINVATGIGVGAPVSPGPLMQVSSTARVVTIHLDTSLEGEVRVGDSLIVTLPNNTTAPGHITYVSKVATSGPNGTTLIAYAVLARSALTGMTDQTPVQVAITTGEVRHALVVPVAALLANADGSYAVEEVTHGAHHLVKVRVGMFDDADGLVQVKGSGLAPGQHVVVPGS